MSPKVKLLVVDDDKRLRELLDRYLTDNGYEIETASNTREARVILNQSHINLMVLDVMMPGETGFDFIKFIRKENSTNKALPILLLTARGESEDRINGLELGADDYLNKPFEPKELLLRIQKLLERSRGSNPNFASHVDFGGFRFNVVHKTLYKDKVIIYLTSTESELLSLLITNVGNALSRDELAERSGITLSPRTIDVQITRLRKKIEGDAKRPQFIKTVRHKGYVFSRYSDGIDV